MLRYYTNMNILPNLVEILKGDEEKEFYSPCFGPIKLKEVSQYKVTVEILTGPESGCEIWLNVDGTYNTGNEVMIYPSKSDRDWESYYYIKMNCPGWEEYVKETNDTTIFNNIDLSNIQVNNNLEASVIAYIKIYKIINYFYNKTKKTYTGIDYNKQIQYHCDNNREYWPFMFETAEAASNFLKNHKNKELVNQYFNI